MDMYFYREEAKVEMSFQDITMDGSKVYRMAAKRQEKEEERRKDRRTTEARQAEDGENWKTRGLHFTSDVQMMLWVYVWIGCCIANGYSHPINRHAIPNSKILAYRKFCGFPFGPHVCMLANVAGVKIPGSRSTLNWLL